MKRPDEKVQLSGHQGGLRGSAFGGRRMPCGQMVQATPPLP
jgi:hypothetical protein